MPFFYPKVVSGPRVWLAPAYPAGRAPLLEPFMLCSHQLSTPEGSFVFLQRLDVVMRLLNIGVPLSNADLTTGHDIHLRLHHSLLSSQLQGQYCNVQAPPPQNLLGWV